MLFLTMACSSHATKQKPLFDVLESNETGIRFANTLTPTPAFNLFSYMYYYNGAGAGAGIISIFVNSTTADSLPLTSVIDASAAFLPGVAGLAVA